MKYQIRVRNESGDDFGRHTFPAKPTDDELRAFLFELSPGDFVDGSRGPGEFGSYLHVEEVTPRVAKPRRVAAKKEKRHG